MAELLYRIGHLSARFAKTTMAIWLIILALSAGAYQLFGGTLTSNITIPETPTSQVTDHLKESFPQLSGGSASVVINTENGEPFTTAQEQEVADLVTQASKSPRVVAVADPFITQAERDAQGEKLQAGIDQLEEAKAQLAQSGLTGEELKATQNELEVQGAVLEVSASLLQHASGFRAVSEDGATAIITISFDDELISISPEDKQELIDLFQENEITGVETNISSEIFLAEPSIMGPSEIVGIVFAAIVLFIMLGTIIGAGLPLITALVGVGIGSLATMTLSGTVEMTSTTPILGIMLGLAVGIDYSLFIVNRHRRQLKEGYTVQESIALATGTSGNAVVFAGATVIIALLALNISGIPFLGLMGSVGALSIAIAVLVSITLTPALLSKVGNKILSKKERRHVGTEAALKAQAQEAKTAFKEPKTLTAWLRIIAGVGALLALAIPSLSLHLNLPDGSSEAHDSTQYKAYIRTAEAFGEGINGPLLVVADLDEPSTEETLLNSQASIVEAIAKDDRVSSVAPIGVSEDGIVLAFQVIPVEGPTSISTEELVHSLRELDISGTGELGVAGAASGNIDISNKLSEALPLYLVVVIGLSIVILILVFRSILVPIIATLGFILSYFAALGGVVAIYQWGHLGSIFGVESPAPILSFLPTLLVGILFGLAMDYMLFIGSGIREAYSHGASARQAVQHGVHAGRSVVMAAAIIMMSVFGGFIFSHATMIRPIGFALALGVLADAFIVRLWIIPALLHILGDKAWWLPKWLEKLLPNVDVEGASLERKHPHHEVDATDTDKTELPVEGEQAHSE